MFDKKAELPSLKVQIVTLLLTCGAYFVLAKLSLLLPVIGGNVSAIWPPSGFSVAALLLIGRRIAPALWLGAFLATASTGAPWLVAAGIACGNTLEYWVAAWIVRRWCGADTDLSRIRDLLILLIPAAFLPSLLAAGIGAASLAVGGVAPWVAYFAIAQTWWLGDALAIVLLTPFLLVWGRRGRRGLRRPTEWVAAVAVTLICSIIVFGDWSLLAFKQQTAAYLVFPPALWAALRLGMCGATTAILVAVLPAIVFTALGSGPFAQSDYTISLLNLQEFMAVVGMTILATAAALEERDAASQQARLLARAVEQSATTVVITDEQADIVYVNPAFTHVTGYEPGEVLGKNPRLLKSRHTAAEDYAALWQRLRDGLTWRGELANRVKDGSIAWMAASISPLLDADGATTHYVATEENVTERKTHELEREQLIASLNARNADLSRFSEVTAHHLMEPSRRLLVYTQRLSSRIRDRLEDEDMRLSLLYIEQGATRLRNLVRDIERYLAAEYPRGPLVMHDLALIIAALKQRFATRLTAYNAVIEISDLPPVYLDSARLTDILEALLDNALIHRSPDIAPRIRISGGRYARGTRLRVEDNGPGIPEEYRQRVFEVFERLAINPEAGTGIGLAIARRIVESRGGRIWIETSPQGGTAVLVDLPDSSEI
jgi:PAS domain S-box-containing protein